MTISEFGGINENPAGRDQSAGHEAANKLFENVADTHDLAREANNLIALLDKSPEQFAKQAIPFLEQVKESPTLPQQRKVEAANMESTLKTPAGPALLSDPGIRDSVKMFLQEVAQPELYRY